MCSEVTAFMAQEMVSVAFEENENEPFEVCVPSASKRAPLWGAGGSSLGCWGLLLDALLFVCRRQICLGIPMLFLRIPIIFLGIPMTFLGIPMIFL